MILILFRSRLAPEADDEYATILADMNRLAQGAPGFVDVKSFKAEDGERLTVVRWHNEETLTAWRENVQHLAAQRMGREKWYANYELEVATITRSSRFERQV